MSTHSEISSPHLHPADDLAYRTFSKSAIAGFVLGVLSGLVLFHVLFVFVASTGVVVSAVALLQISRDPETFSGKKLAWCGFTLSLFLLTAGTVRFFAFREALVSGANQVSELWFDAIRKGEPERAFMWTLKPEERPNENESPHDFFQRLPARRESLEVFLGQPAIKTLDALRNKAEFRWYQTDWTESRGKSDQVMVTYAITAGTEHRATFFVCLTWDRIKRGPKAGEWLMSAFPKGGCKPIGWSDPEKPRGPR